MGLSVGDRLGPYEVVGALGAGGMGQVYRARDSRLDRDVALKILPDLTPRNGDATLRRSFLTEFTTVVVVQNWSEDLKRLVP